jgi:hypothetical protein
MRFVMGDGIAKLVCRTSKQHRSLLYHRHAPGPKQFQVLSVLYIHPLPIGFSLDNYLVNISVPLFSRCTLIRATTAEPASPARDLITYIVLNYHLLSYLSSRGIRRGDLAFLLFTTNGVSSIIILLTEYHTNITISLRPTLPVLSSSNNTAIRPLFRPSKYLA